MRGSQVALVLVVAVCALPLHAQTSGQPYNSLAEFQPGARIRVRAPGIVAGGYVGTVLARTPDTISVGSPTGAPVVLPISRITSLEISRGKSKMLGAKRGVIWGAPIGLAFGALALSGPECTNCTDEPSDAGYVVLFTLSGAVWGAGIGAIIGRERWDEFQLATRTSIGVSPSGVTLGMRLPTP